MQILHRKLICSHYYRLAFMACVKSHFLNIFKTRIKNPFDSKNVWKRWYSSWFHSKLNNFFFSGHLPFLANLIDFSDFFPTNFQIGSVYEQIKRLFTNHKHSFWSPLQRSVSYHSWFLRSSGLLMLKDIKLNFLFFQIITNFLKQNLFIFLVLYFGFYSIFIRIHPFNK